ncbi:MAG: hypothetical protein IMZ58_10695 [Thermoplasmata archaeon]|nr:hypothetical protein [Thermoplasmata archaeon]
MDMDDIRDKLTLIIIVIIIVAIVGTYLGISSGTINQINGWLISIFIGFILSTISGSLVEAVSGDILKTIFLNIPIYGDFSISISVFAIATFIVKVSLFGL